MTQPLLNLTIHQRTVLLTTSTVRAALGVDADTIHARVDSGEIRWVWDVAVCPGTIRELRFWSREIIAPETVRALTPSAVAEAVAGYEMMERLRGVTVAQLLLVSRPHIMRLVQCAELRGGVNGSSIWVDRDHLVRWLESRLVGHVVSRGGAETL